MLHHTLGSNATAGNRLTKAASQSRNVVNLPLGQVSNQSTSAVVMDKQIAKHATRMASSRNTQPRHAQQAV
jgi:hypothetical protein